MRVFLLTMWLLLALPIEVNATEFTPPTVPYSAREWMPERTDSFGDGLWEMLQKAALSLEPSFREGAGVSLAAFAGAMLVSLLKTLGGRAQTLAELTGCVTVGAALLSGSKSLIRLGAETVQSLSDYGKLLLPVMTGALACQGGVGASTALYAGTALFDAVLSSLISRLLLPMVYLYLALAVASGALGEDTLKGMKELVKGGTSWCLKTLLTVFTTYMGITGVVSGTTDAAALKATKVTISTMVPVVGGILSDASEAVLVSAGLAKNAAGIYGIFGILALFLTPFLKIGVQYLLLKGTAALCAIFGSKAITTLIGDFSTAMGLLLAMTGSVCLLLLISTVCFLKGVG